MITHEQATDAILDLFATAWANATPIAYPNVAFSPPEGEPWVRITVRHGEATLVSLGTAPCFRRRGVAIVQVFATEGEAGAGALQLADQVVSTLQAKLTSGVQLQASAVQEIGPDGRGHYQVNVSTPFSYTQASA